MTAPSPDISGPRPKIFVGHPCHNDGCTTLAFYRATGPHGTMWYCLEHAAKYREIMAALSCSVHVELVTEEPELPPAPETFVEAWTCINCLARGDFEVPSTTSIRDVRQRIFDEHHASSPACDVIDARWRLYDRRAAAVLP